MNTRAPRRRPGFRDLLRQERDRLGTLRIPSATAAAARTSGSSRELNNSRSRSHEPWSSETPSARTANPLTITSGVPVAALRRNPQAASLSGRPPGASPRAARARSAKRPAPPCPCRSTMHVRARSGTNPFGPPLRAPGPWPCVPGASCPETPASFRTYRPGRACACPSLIRPRSPVRDPRKRCHGEGLQIFALLGEEELQERGAPRASQSSPIPMMTPAFASPFTRGSRASVRAARVFPGPASGRERPRRKPGVADRSPRTSACFRVPRPPRRP